VTVASRRIAEAMTRLSEQNTTAGGLVRAWGELLAKWMAGSNFRAGSPVTTTLLELAPDEANVTKAGRKAFGDWRRIVSDKLMGDGVPPAQADRLAALVIASLEGGLIQCRVEARPDILLTIAGELERLLEAVVASLRKA
jgi:TetR/AcrR family transcriptional regulator, lmrAB and yxaGH operons repressor